MAITFKEVTSLKDEHWSYSYNKFFGGLRFHVTAIELNDNSWLYYNSGSNTLSGNIIETEPQPVQIIFTNNLQNQIFYSDDEEVTIKSVATGTPSSIEVLDEFTTQDYYISIDEIHTATCSEYDKSIPSSNVVSGIINPTTIEDITETFTRTTYSRLCNISMHQKSDDGLVSINIYTKIKVNNQLTLYAPIIYFSNVISPAQHGNLVPNTLVENITINDVRYSYIGFTGSNTYTWAAPTPNRVIHISDTGMTISSESRGVQVSYLSIDSANDVISTIADLGVYVKIGDSFYLGEMLSNGATTGRLLNPDEWDTAYNKNSESASRDISYDPPGPGPGPGPTPGGDIDPPEAMVNGNGTGFGGFTSYFILTRSDLLDVISNINSQSKAGFDFEYSIDSLFGLAVPPSLVYTTTNVNSLVISGGVNSNSEGATIKNANIVIDGPFTGATGQKSIIDCGSKHINRIHGNFLDFEPYTTIELFIPLCGWVTLPSYCMDKDISVHYVIDGQNCSLTGICVCDGLNVAELPGVFGVSVPFTATASGMKNAAMVESLSTLASGMIAGGLSFALGAKGGLTGSMNASASEIMRVSGISTMASEYIKGLSQTYVAEQGNYVRSVGNLGDRTAFGLGKKCYIRLSTVIENIPSHYAEEIGFIVDDTMTLNQCHGYTVISNPQFAGNYATETEVKMIEELMASGIILPGVDDNTNEE